VPRNVLLLVYVTEINFELVTVYDRTKDETMTDLKYELIEHNEGPLYTGLLIYRVKALRDFADVKAGDIGGYVNGPDNLSQNGNCWVYDNGKLYDNSKVSCNAQVRHNATMMSNARISDNVKLLNNARISNNAKIYGNVVIKDDAIIMENAILNHDVVVSGHSLVSGNASIYNNVTISGAVSIKDCVQIFGNAKISGSAMVRGNSIVNGNAVISHYMLIGFGFVNIDLTASLSDSIRCQTGLAINPITNTIICYKRVRKDTLISFYEDRFAYKVGEYVEEPLPEYSNKSCAKGLHFSYTTYWDSRINIDESCLLMCEVKLDDIITCQEGKIRAKKCFVICICG